MHFRAARVEEHRLVVFGDGLGELSLLVQGDRLDIMFLGLVLVLCQGLFQPLDVRLPLDGFGVDVPFFVHLGVAGIKPYHLAVIGHRLLRLAGIQVNHRAVEAGLGAVGVQFHGLVEIGQGLVELRASGRR